MRYAAVVGLAARARDAAQAYNAFRWLAAGAGPEWLQLYVATLVSKFQAQGHLADLVELMQRDPELAGLVGSAAELAEA